MQKFSNIRDWKFLPLPFLLYINQLITAKRTPDNFFAKITNAPELANYSVIPILVFTASCLIA